MRRARRGQAGAAPYGALPQRTRGIRANRVQCGFPGIASTTAARAAPSDSAVLWLPNACTTCMRHPPSERGTPIRRHGLDPRRRKSSIHRTPAGTAMAFDGGPITSASLPPVARLSSTFCLPLLHRIRRPSSPITFKTPAIVAQWTLMLSPSSRVVICCRRTPLLDWLRGPLQCDLPVKGAHGFLEGLGC